MGKERLLHRFFRDGAPQSSASHDMLALKQELKKEEIKEEEKEKDHKTSFVTWAKHAFEKHVHLSDSMYLQGDSFSRCEEASGASGGEVSFHLSAALLHMLNSALTLHGIPAFCPLTISMLTSILFLLYLPLLG